MNQTTQRSLLAMAGVLIIAVLLALAGSQGSQEAGGIPIFALGVGLAFLMNWLAFIPAYLYQTELFYDLTGSITYITVTVVAVLLSPEADARSLLLLAVVGVWALRLGTFLFRRILKSGKDDRFDEIKPNVARFLLTWTLQGLWVSFTLAAALAAITSTHRADLGLFAIIGLLVWLFGFGFEAVADWQKSRFRARPANQGDFINTGLWAWSRHPNYFGEITLWVGVAIIALPALEGWQLVTLLSPVFVYLLITRVSGVPMLEKKADERWGGQPEYEAYKAETPVLVPVPPGGRARSR